MSAPAMGVVETWRKENLVGYRVGSGKRPGRVRVDETTGVVWCVTCHESGRCRHVRAFRRQVDVKPLYRVTT